MTVTELAEENARLRAQVRELLPWARGVTYFWTHLQAQELRQRIDDGEFGWVENEDGEWVEVRA